MDNRTSNRVCQLLIRHYFDVTAKYLLAIYRNSPIGSDGNWEHEIITDIHDAFMSMQKKGQADIVGEELVIITSYGERGDIGVVKTFAKFFAWNHIRIIQRDLTQQRTYFEYRQRLGLSQFEQPSLALESEFWKFICCKLDDKQMIYVTHVLEDVQPQKMSGILGDTPGARRSFGSRTRQTLRQLHEQFVAQQEFTLRGSKQ